MFTSSHLYILTFNLSTSSLLITKMLCNLRSFFFWCLPVCNVKSLPLISIPNYHNDLNGHCEFFVFYIYSVCVWFLYFASPGKDHFYVGGKLQKWFIVKRQKASLPPLPPPPQFLFCNKKFMRCDEECFLLLPVFCWLLLLLHTISVIKNYYSNWLRKKW